MTTLSPCPTAKSLVQRVTDRYPSDSSSAQPGLTPFSFPLHNCPASFGFALQRFRSIQEPLKVLSPPGYRIRAILCAHPVIHGREYSNAAVSYRGLGEITSTYSSLGIGCGLDETSNIVPCHCGYQQPLMALLNASYIVIFPFLVFFTVPLAILAGVTTTLAFAILIFRVLLVYVQLFMSLLPSCLTQGHRSRHASYYGYGPASLSKSPSSSLASSSSGELAAPTFTPPLLTNASRSLSLNRIPQQQRRPRSRRPSSTSAAARDVSAPPLDSEGGSGSMGLIPSIGIGRDFEGIGGWRFGHDDDADDERWATINSRLEFFDRLHHGARHHQRGPSADGGLMMKGRRRTRSRSPQAVINSHGGVSGVAHVSPNSSRVRMPGVSGALLPVARAPREDDGEYFPLVTSI
ncbi:hypothetical protein SODALDRAFT_374527 [Sodiomyces alkalinus F11]|uniref:Uncharacterized protein n=1 Tax=Sodiomyces alkalinus (strain CBS 110278 / VKM F-3762 / F11) TaxID=1314773 RepID=A0A3N2Q5V6_SODAK|nr:hypothetical protein SODALDRAFT_374527 [Sodiomyces alkalinus F11]ROT42163.1 hypothetical protein SODALDRAFT_374527 [Sodiomyces alkalinus F11]